MSVCLWVCVSTCLYVCGYVCPRVCISLCPSACMSVCLSVCVCVNKCMCMCMCVCKWGSYHTFIAPALLIGGCLKGDFPISRCLLLFPNPRYRVYVGLIFSLFFTQSPNLSRHFLKILNLDNQIVIIAYDPKPQVCVPGCVYNTNVHTGTYTQTDTARHGWGQSDNLQT